MNEYDRAYFKYNVGLPFLLLGYTPDDRWWFGIGGAFTKHGWRKEPYESKHVYSARFAPGSKNTFIFNYQGDYTDVLFRKWNFMPEVSFTNPFYINFFGLGNESIDDNPDMMYNWVRMSNYGLNAAIGEKWLNGKSSIKFGPNYNSFKLVNVEDRVLDELLEPDSEEFDRDTYLGFGIEYELNSVDNNASPNQGIRFAAGLNYQKSLGDDDNDLTTFHLDGTFYLQLLAKPKLNFATRAAYVKVFGDPNLYQYPTLGNNNGLRAFRNERFRGETSFIHMMDLRLHLFNWNNDILPMSVGVMGGYDYGRVWLDGEDFDGFHSGYTFGLTMNILDLAVLHPYYSISDETEQFSLRLGFSF